MVLGAESTGEHRDGLVCYFGEPAWTNARFTIVDTPAGGALVVSRQGADGRPDLRRIDLESITNLDELTEGMDAEALRGYQRLEIGVERAICCQIIWPADFTGLLLSALERTVQPPQHA